MCLVALAVIGFDASAQHTGRRKTPAAATSPFSSNVFVKKIVEPDSLELARRDSVHRADSLFKADSAALQSKSSLAKPAFSSARDSIVEVFTNGQRMIYYYGDVSVKYDDVELKAERMDYNMSTGSVYAHGVYDSLKGEWIGRPVMTQAGQRFDIQEARYNFNTRQAYLTNIVTTEEDGILHGKTVKMMEDRSINVSDGKYTVCDAENPHYYLGLTVAKVMTEPSRKIIFGPAYLVVEDVVLPIGLPYGFVPKRPERATGLLMPTIGEEEARGFYMRDLGMYFVFGDFMDLSLTGSYYTLGSWAVDLNSRYKIKYKANGDISLTYSDDRTGEKGSADYFQSTNFAFKWTHSQDPKAHPGTSFSASVNFSSPSNNRFNSHSVTEALQNQASSSISYSKNWNGKFNLSINGLHSQNSRDSSYVFTLPNITFSMSTIYPFKRKVRIGKEKIYEKISIGYNTSLQNKVNFKASEFGNMDIADRMQSGMTHNFNLGLPTFQLFKYITVNPAFNYGMNWFFRASEAVYNPETDRVEMVQGKAFNHFGITQNYSGSISASTRLYGMYQFGNYSHIQAIRHVISPSVSINLSPELGTYANGYRTLKYTDREGLEKEYQYNIYSGQIYSAPASGKSATASINIGNNLEAKVRDYADTTGKGFKKVKLIDQFNINTGYNFLRDSLRMNPVSLTMTTSLFGKLNISASAAFDPYACDEQGRKYNDFAINNGQGLLRLTNASASLAYSLSGKGAINGNDGKRDVEGGGAVKGAADYYQRVYYHPVTGEYIPGGWVYYNNPNAPWTLNLSYSLNYTKSYSKNSFDNIMQTLSLSGNIKLTPRMSINMNTGVDLKAMRITTTQISATYDLHCFHISVSWVPTGTWKSYSFQICANAAALADLLKYKKSTSFWDK